MCNKKIKYGCVKTFGKCVVYEGVVSENTNLAEECYNLEEVTQDQYELIDDIYSQINVATLTSECVTLETNKTPLNVIESILTKMCQMQEQIDEQNTTISEQQIQIDNLQANICQ